MKVMKILRDQRYAGDMVGNVRVTTIVAKTDNIRVEKKIGLLWRTLMMVLCQKSYSIKLMTRLCH